MDLAGVKGAVDKVNQETLPQAERVLDEAVAELARNVLQSIDRATVQFAEVMNSSLLLVQGIEEKTKEDLQSVVDSLDGWTVTLDPPVIIKTIRLNKPKEPRA